MDSRPDRNSGGTRIEVAVSCKVEEHGGRDRLIPNGFSWYDQDLSFCVHGIKLRWRCDDCAEHFGDGGGEDSDEGT